MTTNDHSSDDDNNDHDYNDDDDDNNDFSQNLEFRKLIPMQLEYTS